MSDNTKSLVSQSVLGLLLFINALAIYFVLLPMATTHFYVKTGLRLESYFEVVLILSLFFCVLTIAAFANRRLWTTKFALLLVAFMACLNAIMILDLRSQTNTIEQLQQSVNAEVSTDFPQLSYLSSSESVDKNRENIMAGTYSVLGFIILLNTVIIAKAGLSSSKLRLS